MLDPGPLRVRECDVVIRSIESLQLALENVVGVRSTGDHAAQTCEREQHLAYRSGAPFVHQAVIEAGIKKSRRLVARYLNFVSDIGLVAFNGR